MSVEDLPARLREICEGVGGPSAMAKKSGVPLRTLNEHLAGTKMSVDRLVAYADAGEVRVDWLATGAEPKGRSDLESLAASAREAVQHAQYEISEAAEKVGLKVVPRGGTATVVARPGGKASGYKSSEGGLAMPEPHADFDPRSVELLDRSVLVEMLTKYFSLLDALKLNWTPEQRAKRFLLVYERCMRAGRVDESSIREAIDMLA